MNKMCRADAELFYDGRIPPDVVDDTLPSRFVPSANANGVRLPARVGRVSAKPEVIRARMAQLIGACLVRGELLEADLKRMFTDAEIAAYAQDALRQALIENPTLPSVEWAA